MTDPVFAWLKRPGHAAVTSIIAMAELLVQPYRNAEEHQVDEFYGLLTTDPHLELAPLALTAKSPIHRIWS